ncbi:DUF4062 domain-containing protein [Lentisphaerota bacterium WC36G]|nr:DUF4062 domain-containing protein [Lentisphaerae bacterium WC36]
MSLNKKYQVFVSSTYTDLKEERRKVIQTLMEMDCIPAGMELFPAMDDEQFNFIKSVIDDSDYYLLIIGGRYGSLNQEGISYTEKEYDYAIEKGMKVLAFVNDNIENLPSKNVDYGDLKQKLDDFKNKVCTGRLVKFWKNARDLPALVALSLNKIRTVYPAVGWSRGSFSSNTELLSEINDLRKENEKLKKQLIDYNNVENFGNLSNGNDTIELFGTCKHGYPSVSAEWKVQVSWNEIIELIGAKLFVAKTRQSINATLSRLLAQKFYDIVHSAKLDLSISNKIELQLTALGVIKRVITNDRGGHEIIKFIITTQGEKLLNELTLETKK